MLYGTSNTALPSTSLVFPIFNEEEVLPSLRKALDQFFRNWPGKLEFVLVDDASEDRTAKILRQWQLEDPRVVVKTTQKNTGHQNALVQGLQIARGEVIVTLDADLQDPLEIIPNMIREYQQGFEVVHTRRTRRVGEPLYRRVLAWSFYRLVKLRYRKILVDVGDFRLMSSKARDLYFNGAQKNQLLRARIPMLSVSQTVISYERKPRAAGISKFTLPRLFQLAYLILGSSGSQNK